MDPEAGTPLKPKAGTSSYGADTAPSGAPAVLNKVKAEADEEVVDTMTYQTTSLMTWQALFMRGNSVWLSSTLWLTLLKLLMVSLVVGIIVFFVMEDPAKLKVSKFLKVSTFLNVFVGLLLGFFLSSSMTRWYNCANGFLVLFDAIRNLQMQFFALGANEFKAHMCVRFGVLSAYLLEMELSLSVLESAEEQKAALKTMWDELMAPKGAVPGNDEHVAFKTMFEAERDLLEQCNDPAGMMFLWVGSLVGRMAQDGDIPPMASPTYGRIMNLAQNGHEGIRQVRAAITIQAPFIYVHMLASLVHINNLLNAVAFGMTCGVAMGVVMAHHNVHPGDNVEASAREATVDLQNVVVSFFFSMFGPFLYQALLEVSICVAQPFANKAGAIPTRRLLRSLECDLRDAIRMSKKTPWWEQPSFVKT